MVKLQTPPENFKATLQIKTKTLTGIYCKKRSGIKADINSIFLKLFRAIGSSTAGLQKLTKSTIYNSKTTKAIFMKFKKSKVIYLPFVRAKLF